MCKSANYANLQKEKADAKVANLQTITLHHYVQELLNSCLSFRTYVEDIGVEPMTPSLQS